ncbi:hypothetical protein VDGD_21224 [Verticillium dahliae]|nr:hypothetical protein VDGD_21224 [Verticillium dahliae]
MTAEEFAINVGQIEGNLETALKAIETVTTPAS